jgi:hypothetical protein
MISSNQQSRNSLTPEAPAKPIRHMGQKDLARRWNLSHRTLERWRSHGDGPPFLKLNGRCLYRMEDIEQFEQARLKASTSGSSAAARKR